MCSTRVVLLSFLFPYVVQAGLFKCQQPDGSVSYQQAPCPESAQQYEIDPNARPSGSAGSGGDYSVGAQLKRLEQSKREERKERQKRRLAVEKEQEEKGESAWSGEDTADCAKHRAQAAEWKRRNRGGYSNRDDRDYKKNKLRYYQIKAQEACGE